MKFWFEMSRVEATRPPTLTCDPRVKSTPAELTMKTCPFAWSAPEMTLCSLPRTRLSVADALLGWLKLTVSDGAMEKPSQLMTARLVDWLTLVVGPDWEMAAE